MTQTDTNRAFFLPPNQTRALNSLLKTTTIQAASEDCGLSTATIKRYLADGNFASAYRQQRMIILQETLGGLIKLGARAIEELEAAMDSGDVNTSLRAATRTLDQLGRFVELERRLRDQEELEARIEALEVAAAAKAVGPWGA
jgi:hypothetical protein